MNEIKDADNDIDIYKLVFIGSNKEKFSFNTFSMPLNFLSAIYNGQISLKQAEFFQRNLEKKMQEVKYNYVELSKKYSRKRRNKWSTDAGKLHVEI